MNVVFFIATLGLGFAAGVFFRSWQLARYFCWVMLSSLEFGGSKDELDAYKHALEKSGNVVPKGLRWTLWVGRD